MGRDATEPGEGALASGLRMLGPKAQALASGGGRGGDHGMVARERVAIGRDHGRWCS